MGDIPWQTVHYLLGDRPAGLSVDIVCLTGIEAGVKDRMLVHVDAGLHLRHSVPERVKGCCIADCVHEAVRAGQDRIMAYDTAVGESVLPPEGLWIANVGEVWEGPEVYRLFLGLHREGHRWVYMPVRDWISLTLDHCWSFGVRTLRIRAFRLDQAWLWSPLEADLSCRR